MTVEMIPFGVAVEAMAEALYETTATALGAALGGKSRMRWDDPAHVVASGPVSLDMRDEWRLAASHVLQVALEREASP